MSDAKAIAAIGVGVLLAVGVAKVSTNETWDAQSKTRSEVLATAKHLSESLSRIDQKLGELDSDTVEINRRLDLILESLRIEDKKKEALHKLACQEDDSCPAESEPEY